MRVVSHEKPVKIGVETRENVKVSFVLTVSSTFAAGQNVVESNVGISLWGKRYEKR